MKASEDFSPEALFVFIDYFTKSLKAFPALNAGTLQAAILIFSPVCGFLPSRAALSRASNVPKPIKETLSPALTAFCMPPINAFNDYC